MSFIAQQINFWLWFMGLSLVFLAIVAFLEYLIIKAMGRKKK